MSKRTTGRSSTERILRETAIPLFLLDHARRVVFFNSGCERLTGSAASDVVGKVCEYSSVDGTSQPDAVAAVFCPPPEVLRGEPADVPAFLPQQDGDPLPRLVRFQPLVDTAGTVSGVLGFILPIPPPVQSIETTPSRQLHAELAALRIELRRRFGMRTFVAKSAAMLRVAEQVALARTANTPVLIRGERGTGKEHIARLIHYESELRHRSFMPLDCRRLSTLELKQALRRFFESSRIEDAGGTHGGPALKPGTVFLAHVHELARDLQQMIVEAFGPDQPNRRIDLRLTASTTVELRPLVENEQIRSDFYFLITAVSVEIPPLRERTDDLPLLAQSLLEELNRGDERQIGGFAENTWELLREYNWPGNIGELRTVIAEARTSCIDTLIRPEDLPFRFRTGLGAQAVAPQVVARAAPLEELLARVEREQIERALAETRQNKSKAAEILGLTRPKLYRRMEALGIEDRELPAT